LQQTQYQTLLYHTSLCMVSSAHQSPDISSSLVPLYNMIACLRDLVVLGRAKMTGSPEFSSLHSLGEDHVRTHLVARDCTGRKRQSAVRSQGCMLCASFSLHKSCHLAMSAWQKYTHANPGLRIHVEVEVHLAEVHG
jgi:hypothetical protein